MKDRGEVMMTHSRCPGCGQTVGDERLEKVAREIYQFMRDYPHDPVPEGLFVDLGDALGGDEAHAKRGEITDENYFAALAEIYELFDAKPNTPDGDRLETLVTLVEAYEAKYYLIPSPDPSAMIEYYLESRGLGGKRVEKLEAVEEAALAWRSYLIGKYGDEDWKCPYVADLMAALDDDEAHAKHGECCTGDGPNQDWKAVGKAIELLQEDGYTVGIGSLSGGNWCDWCSPSSDLVETRVRAGCEPTELLTLAEVVERLIGGLYEAGCPPPWIEKQLEGTCRHGKLDADTCPECYLTTRPEPRMAW